MDFLCQTNQPLDVKIEIKEEFDKNQIQNINNNKCVFSQNIEYEKYYRVEYDKYNYKFFKCELCNEYFIERQLLYSHINKCANKSKTENQNIPSQPILQVDIKGEIENKFEEIIEEKDKINDPLNVNFQCGLCDSELESMNNSINHMKLTHNVMKQLSEIHICPICNKVFPDLKNHTHEIKQNKFDRTPQYKCELCKKYFGDKHLLISHVTKLQCEHMSKTSNEIMPSFLHLKPQPSFLNYMNKSVQVIKLKVKKVKKHIRKFKKIQVNRRKNIQTELPAADGGPNRSLRF